MSEGINNILTEEQQLAHVLHKYMCHFNHIDMCSWDYEKWDDHNNTTKLKYLNKAKQMLAIVDFKTALHIVNALYV